MFKARLMRPIMQDYSNQRYIAAQLDANYLEKLQDHSNILYVHGAMEAPNFIPAGSMVCTGNFYFDKATVERGVTLAEQQEIDKLFAEIINNI